MNQFFRTDVEEADFFSRHDYPDDYLVFDLETTGVVPRKDLIVEVGWAVVRDRAVKECEGLILDWTPCQWIDQRWLRESLERLAQIYAEKGRVWHIPYERLAAEGVEPMSALGVMVQILTDALEDDEWIVGHNAWAFDRRMIDAHANQFLNTALPWKDSKIFDTGLMEKAAQLGRPQRPGETREEWLQRIANTRSKVQWNLDGFCAQKYHLAERFNLDVSRAHQAGFDCLLAHCLLETYRAVGEAFDG